MVDGILFIFFEGAGAEPLASPGASSFTPWHARRDACAGWTMEKKRPPRKGSTRSWPDDLYDRKTPLFDRYYKQARKSIHFSRYYKRELNW